MRFTFAVFNRKGGTYRRFSCRLSNLSVPTFSSRTPPPFFPRWIFSFHKAAASFSCLQYGKFLLKYPFLQSAAFRYLPISRLHRFSFFPHYNWIDARRWSNPQSNWFSLLFSPKSWHFPDLTSGKISLVYSSFSFSPIPFFFSYFFLWRTVSLELYFRIRQI